MLEPYISREEIVELTKELVRSPSINPPGDTTGCAEIVLNKFKGNNINAEIIEEKRYCRSSKTLSSTKKLRSLGLKVLELSLGENTKGGGGPHCLTFEIERESK